MNFIRVKSDKDKTSYVSKFLNEDFKIKPHSSIALSQLVLEPVTNSFEITAGVNDTLRFRVKRNGVQYSANLTAGFYSIETLRRELQRALRSAIDTDTTADIINNASADGGAEYGFLWKVDYNTTIKAFTFAYMKSVFNVVAPLPIFDRSENGSGNPDIKKFKSTGTGKDKYAKYVCATDGTVDPRGYWTCYMTSSSEAITVNTSSTVIQGTGYISMSSVYGGTPTSPVVSPFIYGIIDKNTSPTVATYINDFDSNPAEQISKFKIGYMLDYDLTANRSEKLIVNGVAYDIANPVDVIDDVRLYFRIYEGKVTLQYADQIAGTYVDVQRAIDNKTDFELDVNVEHQILCYFKDIEATIIQYSAVMNPNFFLAKDETFKHHYGASYGETILDFVNVETANFLGFTTTSVSDIDSATRMGGVFVPQNELQGHYVDIPSFLVLLESADLQNYDTKTRKKSSILAMIPYLDEKKGLLIHEPSEMKFMALNNEKEMLLRDFRLRLVNFDGEDMPNEKNLDIGLMIKQG